MAENDEQNTGGSQSDNRFAGSSETPVSPTLAPPPFTQVAPEIFVPSEEQRQLHAQDALQQQRVADLLHHLAGFRNGPEDENWDSDAYEKLTQIPGIALEPLGVMLGHGSAIRSQLVYFQTAQADLTAQLAAVTRERDRLTQSALIDQRVRM
ncbi:hypothetical protein B484DRAFT_465002, partial [Ochromonadaceae sp. CCMP2298]